MGASTKKAGSTEVQRAAGGVYPSAFLSNLLQSQTLGFYFLPEVQTFLRPGRFHIIQKESPKPLPCFTSCGGGWLWSKIYILLLHYLGEFWASIQATIFQSPKARLPFLGVDRNTSMSCLAWFAFRSSYLSS